MFIHYIDGNIIWKKFSSPQIGSNVTLLANGSFERPVPNSKVSSVSKFFFIQHFKLSNGGVGFVANFNYTIADLSINIYEVYVSFLEFNATKLSKPYLLYTSKYLTNETFTFKPYSMYNSFIIQLIFAIYKNIYYTFISYRL